MDDGVKKGVAGHRTITEKNKLGMPAKEMNSAAMPTETTSPDKETVEFYLQ